LYPIPDNTIARMADTPEPTEAEKSLIANTAKGDITDFRTGDEEKDDPANGTGWGPERTIRAEILYALCTGARDDWPAHAKGVQLCSPGSRDGSTSISPRSTNLLI
jgi:hypothetical protein